MDTSGYEWREAMVGFAACFVLALVLVAVAFVVRKRCPTKWGLVANIALSLWAGALAFWPGGETLYLTTHSGASAGIAAFTAALSAAVAMFLWVRTEMRARMSLEPPRRVKTATGARPPAEAPAATITSGANPADVFISYKRDERDDVIRIARRLEALGLKVWFDAEMQSGTTFDVEIDRQVRAAKCVLVCWSPGAVASDWVRGEATIGRQRNVLCAAILRPCELPAPFNLTHANDLAAGAVSGNPEWLRVLERIGPLVGRPGLAGYEALETSTSSADYGAWIASNAHDPLLDDVMRRLRALAAG